MTSLGTFCCRMSFTTLGVGNVIAQKVVLMDVIRQLLVWGVGNKDLVVCLQSGDSYDDRLIDVDTGVVTFSNIYRNNF